MTHAVPVKVTADDAHWTPSRAAESRDETDLVDIGIYSTQTGFTIQPSELATWAEEQGFDSVFFGEHLHVHSGLTSAFARGWQIEMPDHYLAISDPLVCATAAAAVTDRLTVGTAVRLLPGHHPLSLAKSVSCVDLVSRGRLVLGVDGVWIAHEPGDDGSDPADRWLIARERVLAMRQIWGNDIAEFHGDFVDFGPVWCLPRPIQPGGPPLLIGAAPSEQIARHIVEYGDGWMPMDGADDLAGGMASIRAEAARVGRPDTELDFTVITACQPSGLSGSVQRVKELAELGFNRVLLLLEAGDPDIQWAELRRFTELLRATGQQLNVAMGDGNLSL